MVFKDAKKHKQFSPHRNFPLFLKEFFIFYNIILKGFKRQIVKNDVGNSRWDNISLFNLIEKKNPLNNKYTRSTQPSDCGQFGVSEKLTMYLPYGRYMAVLRLPTSCPRQPYGNWRKTAQKLPMSSVAEKLPGIGFYCQFLGRIWNM